MANCNGHFHRKSSGSGGKAKRHRIALNIVEGSNKGEQNISGTGGFLKVGADGSPYCIAIVGPH